MTKAEFEAEWAVKISRPFKDHIAPNEFSTGWYQFVEANIHALSPSAKRYILDQGQETIGSWIIELVVYQAIEDALSLEMV